MLNKICSFGGCNRVVLVDPLCSDPPRCPAHKYSHPEKKKYSHHYVNGRNFYTTPQWRKLRAAYVKANPFCEECLTVGLVTPVAEVDHIKEIIDGGELLDPKNLKSLCRSCHNRKTKKEKLRRAARDTGFPSLEDF